MWEIKKIDSSTRCNEDFQWIRKEPSLPKMEETAPVAKPPPGPTRSKTPRKEKTAPGSLDRRRPQNSRQERDLKSRSTHALKSPPRLDDFAPCQNWCCSPHDNGLNPCLENFHRRHERMDPQRYGSSPMLMEQRGSHPDIYGDCRYRHEQMMGCCAYHVAPPCCFYGDRGYHWAPPPYLKVSRWARDGGFYTNTCFRYLINNLI